MMTESEFKVFYEDLHEQMNKLADKMDNNFNKVNDRLDDFSRRITCLETEVNHIKDRSPKGQLLWGPIVGAVVAYILAKTQF